MNVIKDDNRGGAALTEAAIAAAMRIAGKDSHISLVPTHAVEQGDFRHTVRAHSVEVLDPLVVPLHGPHGTAVALLASLALLVGVPLGVCGVQRHTYAAIKQADLVVSRGGVIVSQRNRSWGDHARLWLAVLPILFARRSGRNVVLLGAQLGPVATIVGRIVIKWTVHSASAILPRGPHSAQLARRYASGRSLVIPIPDSAFLLRPLVAESVGVSGTMTVVPGGDIDISSQLRELARQVLELNRSGRFDHLNVALQTDGAASDRKWLKFFLDALDGKFEGAVNVLDEDFSVEEYRRHLATAELVISTRMHSVVLALNASTPALAVSIDDDYRKSDVLQGIGMPELLVTPQEVGSAAEKLMSRNRDNFSSVAITSHQRLERALEAVRTEVFGRAARDTRF